MSIAASPLRNSVLIPAVRTPRLRRRPLRKKSAGPSCGRTTRDLRFDSGRATCLWSRARFQRRRPSPRSSRSYPWPRPSANSWGTARRIGPRHVQKQVADSRSPAISSISRHSGRAGASASTSTRASPRDSRGPLVPSILMLARSPDQSLWRDSTGTPRGRPSAR